MKSLCCSDDKGKSTDFIIIHSLMQLYKVYSLGFSHTVLKIKPLKIRHEENESYSRICLNSVNLIIFRIIPHNKSLIYINR